MIPDSIKREHILKAIDEVKGSEIPAERDSDKYDFEYDNRLYPPKYIVSLANKYANGKELDHVIFSGGDETNNFLKSRGFNIVDKEPETDFEKEEHDFAPRLWDYLENIYSVRLQKDSRRAHLAFPSGVIINVRGSKILKDHRGFYHLLEDQYKDIVDNSNRFLAVVFGSVENTFVFPKEKVATFFNGYPVTSREGKTPRWYFDIREDNKNYY